jgi:hypothetical protein
MPSDIGFRTSAHGASGLVILVPDQGIGNGWVWGLGPRSGYRKRMGLGPWASHVHFIYTAKNGRDDHFPVVPTYRDQSNNTMDTQQPPSYLGM